MSALPRDLRSSALPRDLQSSALPRVLQSSAQALRRGAASPAESVALA